MIHPEYTDHYQHPIFEYWRIMSNPKPVIDMDDVYSFEATDGKRIELFLVPTCVLDKVRHANVKLLLHHSHGYTFATGEKLVENLELNQNIEPPLLATYPITDSYVAGNTPIMVVHMGMAQVKYVLTGEAIVILQDLLRHLGTHKGLCLVRHSKGFAIQHTGTSISTVSTSQIDYGRIKYVTQPDLLSYVDSLNTKLNKAMDLSDGSFDFEEFGATLEYIDKNRARIKFMGVTVFDSSEETVLESADRRIDQLCSLLAKFRSS